MTKEEITNKLTGIVQPYIQNQEAFDNISEDTDFISDLEINSANLVDIVLDVEDEFNVEFANEDMESLRTINDAIKIIQAKVA